MDSCNADIIEQSNSYLSQLWWHQQQNTASLLLANPGGDSSRASSSLHSRHPIPANNSDVMNQLCRVCGEPAAGFHFGAFTCEGCKSFFGRTYNNLSSISECKNGGQCVINKKNRTSCKACRLRKCLVVGMSKSGSRYGRRSNWFKIHCLLQEQSNNNNNNNNIPSIRQPSNAADNLLINKNKSHADCNDISSWSSADKKCSPSPPISTRSSLIPADWRTNLPSELRNYASSENAASSLAATAAAAFWSAASRGSFSSPFLTSPFNNATPFLFPYMQGNKTADQLSSGTNSPPSSPNLTRETERNSSPIPPRVIDKHSPPPSLHLPRVYDKNSPPNSPYLPRIIEKHSLPPSLNLTRVFDRNSPPNPHIPRIFPIHPGNRSKSPPVAPNVVKEDKLSGLALLRTLGPVQDTPMDLSTKNVHVTSDSEDSDNEINKRDVLLINKPTTPLDLTTQDSE